MKKHLPNYLFFAGLLLTQLLTAQTPIKLKLIGAFWDSTGYSFDTLYFGFHKDGGPGVQAWLDVLDTNSKLTWGTYDNSTPNLRYKTNIREFEPYTYTSFQIYARNNLVYIKWDTTEYQPSFYNFDFVRLSVTLECKNAFFEFPEFYGHAISGRTESWKETNGVNPVDSVRIFIMGVSPQLWVNLGVRDSIHTSINNTKLHQKLEILHSDDANQLLVKNPFELPLKIDIMNHLGQSIAKLPTTSITQITIPLEGLCNGMYYLSITNDHNHTIKKIIIP
jgi:hypothetical protein